MSVCRNIAVIACAVSLSLVLASCSSVGRSAKNIQFESQLMGRWDSQVAPNDPYNFRADGSLTSSSGSVQYDVDYPYIRFIGPNGPVATATVVSHDFSTRPKTITLRFSGGLIDGQVDTLKESGYGNRQAPNPGNPGSIGVTLEPISSANASRYWLEPNQGWFIKEVVINGPAWDAGIRAGDFLVAAEGSILYSFESGDPLGRAKQGKRAGDSIKLLIYRDAMNGQFSKRTIAVVLR